jgi:hypothetical protein
MFTHNLPVPPAKPGHVAIRRGCANNIDFKAMQLNRVLPKPKRVGGNKSRSATITTSIATRFPKGGHDTIAAVGMR